jgi:hypothetical protein
MMRSLYAKFGDYLLVPSILAIIAFALLLATASNYGIFTDELYFIACAHHLDFGYVDHPPFVAWITRLALLFGNSLVVLRIFPALAYSGTILTVAMISRALGGSSFAAGVSSLAIMCGTVFWIMFGYVSMNAYDILFITLASYLFILSLFRGSAKYWLLLGMIIGLGLNTKMTMLIFSFSLAIALLISDQRRAYKTLFPYATIAIGFFMFVPHLWWQVANGFPTLEFIKNASDKNLSLPVLTIFGQLIIAANPILLPLWSSGLAWLFLSKKLRPISPLPIAMVLFVCIYLLNHSKFYYILPVLPSLIAAGSVLFEQWTRNSAKWIRLAAVSLLIVSGGLLLPFGLPIIPIASFGSYAQSFGLANHVQTEHREAQIIPGYFGQRFGWQDFTQTVARVYFSLPDSDRVRCGILGFHYGESGAVDFFGPMLGLPPAIGRHNSYWLWGPKVYSGDKLIAIMSGDAQPTSYFKVANLTTTYELPYVDGSFRTHRIYICSTPLEPFPVIWNKLKTYD